MVKIEIIFNLKTLWYISYTQATSMQLRVPQPLKDFTIVPNELLQSALSPSDKETWLMIASVTRDGLFHDSRGMSAISESYGVPYKTFMTRVRRLKEKRVAQDLDIANEVQEQPNRKPSGIKQKDVMAEIKEVWNHHKPETYHRLDGGFPLPLFIAIETHAKRLGIERSEYAVFVTDVLRAANVDPWWSDKALKATSLFGWSADIDDKKFKSIEKLYKSPNKAKLLFDYFERSFWLKWYDGYKDIDKIVFKTADDYWEALDRVEEEVDSKTAYIWYREGSQKPHHWTGHNDQTTRKFRYLP